MHEKNAGGRRRRPLAQSMFCGLERLRARAKLSDAVGYGSHEVPRGSRGKSSKSNRERLL
jgi:hypothetical protein